MSNETTTKVYAFDESILAKMGKNEIRVVHRVARKKHSFKDARKNFVEFIKTAYCSEI